MKKKVAIITGTRAEYGLLKPIIKRISKSYNLKLIVTGTHLSPEFGMTYKEIEDDELKIDERIEVLMSSDTSIGISKSLGLAVISFSELYARLDLDSIIILGDRFEIFACAIAATIAKIPIIHLYGGELTEGAYDESFRHSITKMSHLHFTSTEVYRERVIQLGEQPDRVFNVGSLGVESIKKMNLLSKKDLENSLDFSLGENYAVVTYHPVTLENKSSEEQVTDLIKSLKEYKNLKYVITKCNADSDGRIINKLFESFQRENKDRVFLTESLGQLRYLSSIKYCSLVIGNSSSGIIEAPSLKKITINIGDRQKGRVQSNTIINCSPKYNDIKEAIEKGLNFNLSNREILNPYEKKETTELIVEKINLFLENEVNIKKIFYDIKR